MFFAYWMGSPLPSPFRAQNSLLNCSGGPSERKQECLLPLLEISKSSRRRFWIQVNSKMDSIYFSLLFACRWHLIYVNKVTFNENDVNMVTFNENYVNKGTFVAVSSMSFLIPPTSHPARCGLLLITLLVSICKLAKKMFCIVFLIWNGFMSRPWWICSTRPYLKPPPTPPV